jgi:hypothetical protein
MDSRGIGRVAQELNIELLPSIHGFVKGIGLLDKLAASFTQLPALILGHGHDLTHGFGQGCGVGYGHKQSGFSGKDCLAGSCGVCNHYGQARSGGLEDGYGQAFPK